MWLIVFLLCIGKYLKFTNFKVLKSLSVLPFKDILSIGIFPCLAFFLLLFTYQTGHQLFTVFRAISLLKHSILVVLTLFSQFLLTESFKWSYFLTFLGDLTPYYLISKSKNKRWYPF